MTPMMEQYLRIKERYKDCLLLFRLGDFYEAFFDDAEQLSNVLRIVLTSRNGNPMAGIPYHALSQYLKKLVDAGLKVAICEQVGDPSKSQGLVKREVTRVITPGTLIDEELLSEENNFLMIVSSGKSGYSFAITDISTGQLLVGSCSNIEEIEDRIASFSPSQVLFQRSLKELSKEILGNRPCSFVEYVEDWHFALTSGVEYVKRVYGISSLEALELSEDETALLGALFKYVENSNKGLFKHFYLPAKQRASDHMLIDSVTLSNLSLLTGDPGSSLFDSIKETTTPMGTRLLKERIRRPSRSLQEIEERLDRVEALVHDRRATMELRQFLSHVSDIERITARLVAGRSSPRDMKDLSTTLFHVPDIASVISRFEAFDKLVTSLPDLSEVAQFINGAIQDDPAASPGEGGVIRRGFSTELDELVEILSGANSKMKEFQESQKAATGIPGLKVKYNKVFGYFIEVPRSQSGKIPPDYERKQTLVNAERFINSELKEYEEKLLSAGERLEQLERDLFVEVCENVAKNVEGFQATAMILAEIDVALSSALLALKRHYTRPHFNECNLLCLKASRHPVVERFVESFVPNEAEFFQDKRFAVLTGPNMSGKSTYLRQLGLIAIMAQSGSFVPAEEANLPVYDRIFTRIGARDDLVAGKSTFLVEMLETASILINATENSLVLLDEVGRGTSTFDGISIAWAVSEYIYEVIGCHTMFATHFTELTEMAEMYPGVVNLNVRIEEQGDSIVFLHKVAEGVADRSYGIDVAKLAGIPQSVIDRSREILGIILRTSSLDKAVRVLTADEVKEIKRTKKEKGSRDQIRLF